MRGRALLLGSATGGLAGVSNDVRAMAGWLDGLDLRLDIREGSLATREGMLDGLSRLIRDTQRGEAAVIYYSGHGGFVSVPTHERFVGGRIAPRAFQYLVPTDHDKRERFRGIFRAELSSMIRDLAERTANITVILDCCHSTDMLRDGDLEPKSVVEPWSEGLEAHLAWLEQQGYDIDKLPELRNPSMVLLAAAGAMQKAFEYSRPDDGARCGVLTDCLLHIARRVHDPSRVSWDVLVRRVVERMKQFVRLQRSQVSGPASRCLFSERRISLSGALTLGFVTDRWCLSGGAVAGVAPGDRYGIVDPLAEGSLAPVAEVVVSEVETHASAVEVPAGGAERLTPGMLAVPLPGGPTRQRYRIRGSGALADELQVRLRGIPGLEVDDASLRTDVAFVLDVREEHVHVLDGDGRPLRWPWHDARALDSSMRSERIDDLVEDLRAQVRKRELLAIARASSSVGEPPRSLAHHFEWGLVEGGVPRPLPHHGAELRPGDRIYASVENTGPRPLYVSVLDIGAGRTVSLLNPNEPEGIDLGSGETELFGAPENRPLVGIALEWPDDIPPDGPREESLVVVVSSGPLPIASWETGTCNRAIFRVAAPEPRRSASPVCLVRHVSFVLHPPSATK